MDDEEIEESLHVEGDDDDPTIEKGIDNKTPIMNSLPMGATQQVYQGTDYMVPSQMSYDESKQYDSPDDDNDNSIDNGMSVPYKTSSVPPQGVDAYKDFKHVIESICKLTDAAGMEGRQTLMDGLNDIRARTVQILGGAPSTDGMGTFPKTTNKQKDTRKRMATSPRK